MMPLKSPFLRKILRSLWRKDWNTGNVRAITHIVQNTLRNMKLQVIHFDDDVVIEPHMDINTYIAKLTEDNVIAMNFKWCPDLSKIERLGVYLKQNSKMLPDNVGYSHSLCNMVGVPQLLQKCKTYTDMPIEMINAPRALLDVHNPTREELSWAAYLQNNIPNHNFLVPNRFDEDWYIGGKLRDIYKMKLLCLDAPIQHAASRKSLIIKDHEIAHEYGKILTEAILELHNIFDEKAIVRIVRNIIKRRKEKIKMYLHVLSTLHGSEYNKQVTRWLLAVYKLYQKKNILIETLLKQYKEHNTLVAAYDKIAMRTLLPKQKIYFIAAHCDDAALCASEYIRYLSDYHDVTVHTVFSETSYTVSWYGNIDAVSALRKTENDIFFSWYACKLTYWSMTDACVRCGNNEDDFMDDRNVADATLVDAVMDALNLSKKAYYYFPLWLWWHKDHRILFFVGIRLLLRWYKVHFYGDIWYAAAANKKYISNYLHKLGYKYVMAVYHLSKEQNTKKMTQVANTYISQMDKDLSHNMKKHYRAFGWEVFYNLIPLEDAITV